MFETFLLQSYKQFLKFLEPIAKGKGKNKNKFVYLRKVEKKKSESLQIASVRCLCELLKTHPHFNFSSNIVTLLCPLLTSHNNKVLFIIVLLLKVNR